MVNTVSTTCSLPWYIDVSESNFSPHYLLEKEGHQCVLDQCYSTKCQNIKKSTSFVDSNKGTHAIITYNLFPYLYILHFPEQRYAFGEDQTHSCITT